MWIIYRMSACKHARHTLQQGTSVQGYLDVCSFVFLVAGVPPSPKTRPQKLHFFLTRLSSRQFDSIETLDFEVLVEFLSLPTILLISPVSLLSCFKCWFLNNGLLNEFLRCSFILYYCFVVGKLLVLGITIKSAL